MQKIISFLLFATISTALFGQTHYEKFKKLFKNNDTTTIQRLLTDWEKSTPNDPELYTSAFNFYFSNSKKEILSIEKVQPKKESFQITDSSGAVAGYFSSNMDYNPYKLAKAFGYADKGIEIFPNRLDIRFGKCYVFGEIGDYHNFTAEIIKTVEYGAVIKNNWLWTENKKVEDADNFMTDALQAYLKQLYDTEDDQLLENMKQIGDVVLKYYPNNIEILSTTAVANLLTGNYDKAIGFLKQAEKLNPKDFIVLNNIAHGYKLKGDKANAVKYYELVKIHGDEQAKKQARDEIKKLSN